MLFYATCKRGTTRTRHAPALSHAIGIVSNNCAAHTKQTTSLNSRCPRLVQSFMAKNCCIDNVAPCTCRYQQSASQNAGPKQFRRSLSSTALYVMRFPPGGATTMPNQCKHWSSHPMHLPMPSPTMFQTALRGCNAAALVSRAGA